MDLESRLGLWQFGPELDQSLVSALFCCSSHMASGYLRECREYLCREYLWSLLAPSGEKLGVKIFGLQFQRPFSSLAKGPAPQGEKSVGG